MNTQQYHPGDILQTTKTLHGVTTLNKGDCMRYLGNSQVRILTGPSRDWVMWLSIDAPVVKANQEESK